jgi:GAF domain-containing protein/HAMP domain-containing protein
MAALLSNAYQLEFNLEQQINNVASKNEVHVAESNAKALSEARQRLILFLAIYAALIFMAIVTAISVQASITRPLSSLYAAAEAFRLERKATNIPTEGADELTSLANSFNQITSDLVQSLESLEQRVVSRTKALATSTEVSRSLSNILDQNELVIEVVERVKEAFNYYHVHIYLFDQDRSELIMTGGTGEAGKALLEQGHRIPRGHGLVGRAAEPNLPVLVPDTTADPDWLPNPFLSDTKAEVAVPIASGGIVLGVLDAQQNERDALGQQDVDVLQSIASQVAIALQNSQTYRKTRQQAEHEALVGSISQKIQGETTVEGALQVAVRELGRALGSDYARIRLVTTQSQTEDIHPVVGS